jgi:methionyl-tRNA synthetase
MVPALYALAYPGWQPDVDYNVNEFYGLAGSKFSTSRNHVIWGKDILGPHSVDALRLFLARTRPEGRRTDFERAAYEALLRETLLGEWQGWLADLGDRVERRYGGAAPDAGTWTPEHIAFLARMEHRRAALTASLGPDAFSLNQAADELLGLAADAVRFARAQSPAAQAATWQDEARTAVALELAAARLLAACAAPLMPRFAARLAAAVGAPGPAQWPRLVALPPAGTPVRLAGHSFFGPTLATWLDGLVREALGLSPGEPATGRGLAELGMASLQAVALQYQILDQLGVEVPIADLLGGQTLAELAAMLGDLAAPEAVLAATAGARG